MVFSAGDIAGGAQTRNDGQEGARHDDGDTKFVVVATLGSAGRCRKRQHNVPLQRRHANHSNKEYDNKREQRQRDVDHSHCD